jgi:hypothetical protein
MEDEFARFQAELGALEQAETPAARGEEHQPVEAPTPQAAPAAAHVPAAQVSRPAVIARPAAPASVQAAAQLGGRGDFYGVRPLEACLALSTTHTHTDAKGCNSSLPGPPDGCHAAAPACCVYSPAASSRLALRLPGAAAAPAACVPRGAAARAAGEGGARAQRGWREVGGPVDGGLARQCGPCFCRVAALAVVLCLWLTPARVQLVPQMTTAFLWGTWARR